MKKNKLMIFICILSFIGTIIAYFYLPEQIIGQWNINGEPGRYDPKYTILIIGLLPLALLIMFEYIPKIDPKKDNYQKHEKAYAIIKYMTILFLITINWIVIAINFNAPININLSIGLFMGILFLFIGNYMPQFRQNYFVGIKTPWTLANETVWKKTHQFGGYQFIISGILFILAGLINNALFFYFALGFTIVGSIFVMIYSYIIYRRETLQ